MSKQWPPKDPDETLDYEIDWLQRVTNDDTIVGSQWFLPVELTKESDTYAGQATVIWLSGGVLGDTYVLLNRITTAGGRIMDQSVKLKMKEK
jgi:hypothetical protein